VHYALKKRGIKMSNKENKIIIFTTADGKISVDTYFNEETAWLSLDQMAELFERDNSTISRHIKNVFDESELERTSVVANFATTAADGKIYQVDYYNLDVIISVGYRVKSLRGTQFRKWATKRLNEYIQKGFVLDDERMKSGRNMTYFDELQERIREIRLSEKIFYQKIKDIYTTSVDYDAKDEKTIEFFKIVQNKLLWAISQQTAAELVVRRANAELPFMGMQSYDKKNERRITKQDAITAKNYLSADEMQALGLLVEQYLAFAAAQAQQHIAMTMNNWISKLDAILSLNGRELLTHAGKITHDLAKEISELQLEKLQNRLRQQEIESSLDELEEDLKMLEKEENNL
jgi:hypothetical protein